METALGYDCINLTRSIQADNSPYYERGLRLSYETKNKNWYIALMTLNGWQKIDNSNIFNEAAVWIQPGGESLLVSKKMKPNHYGILIARWCKNCKVTFLEKEKYVK